MSQPLPTPNSGRPIWELVIEDMRRRDAVGRQRYGTPLQAHNGRDALLDAYEEALDLCVYLRQVIEERGSAAVVLKVTSLTPEDREKLRRALECMQHQPLLILPASAHAPHVKPEGPSPG
jgi:hypothetical protein